MKVDVQELGACKRRLEIEESPEVVTQAWDEQGHAERYDEKKLAKAFPTNRNLPFIMNLFAVGIGIQ